MSDSTTRRHAGQTLALATAAGLGLAAALSAVAAGATTTPFFRADFAPGKAPLFGFTMGAGHRHIGERWQLVPRPGAGPAGEDAAEIALLPAKGNETEGYYGWSQFELPPTRQGSSIYVRMKIRLVEPLRYEGANGSGWGTKMVILGDKGRQGSRVIWNLRFDPGDPRRAVFRVERNIDGPAMGGALQTKPLPGNRWIYAQLRIKSSSTFPGGKDGRLSLYIDGDNASEAKPTDQGGPVDLSSATWDDVRLGYYGEYIGANGHVAYQFAGFEVDDAFDPTWMPKAGGR
jgi:hypothetical protein